MQHKGCLGLTLPIGLKFTGASPMSTIFDKVSREPFSFFLNSVFNAFGNKSHV